MYRVLDKRLKNKFEMVGYQPGSFLFKGRKYDTRKMSVKQADEVIKKGARFIKRKEKKVSRD